MKSRFAKILDSVLIGVALFLLSFFVLRYYVKNFYAVLGVSVSITFGVLYAARLLNKKRLQAEKDNYYALLCSRHFLFRDESYTFDYFFYALKKRYQVTKKKKYLKINSTLIAVNLSEPLSIKNAVIYYTEAKKEKAKTLIILTASVLDNFNGIKERLTDVNLEIFLSDRIYRLLKSLDCVPPLVKEKSSFKRYQFVLNAFNPKRFKGYMFTFFTLLFGAIFSVWSIYFLIMSSMALSMAVLSRLGIDEKIKEKTAKTDKPEVD